MFWLRVLGFVALVPGTVLVAVPLALTALGPPQLLSDGVAPLAWGFWGVGGAVLGHGVLEFALRGRGTLAPVDAPRHLVVTGLYRYVRNPMYVAALLILVGHVLYWGTVAHLAYLFAVWLGFHLFIVHYEEPELARRFGDEYAIYRQTVPRWWPRFKPAPPPRPHPPPE